MSSSLPGGPSQTTLDDLQAPRERQFAPLGLRDELLVRAGCVALEDGLGAQARAHVLEPTVRARHELMIQPFVARRAERPGEVSVLKRSDVVLRGLQNMGLKAAADIARNTLEQSVRHVRQVYRRTRGGPAFAGPPIRLPVASVATCDGARVLFVVRISVVVTGAVLVCHESRARRRVSSYAEPMSTPISG